jgi:pyridoxamine 5'-phosphate oxidase
MIKFNKLSKEKPFIVFKEKYYEALSAMEKNIDAMCIASYSIETEEVNSRFVNLKFINDKEFIFFSNYKSPKSREFYSHSQICAIVFWRSINMQIRIKARLRQTSNKFNQTYFEKRDKQKNALAISSEQSCSIDSYEAVQKKYEKSLKNENLIKCPDYWGGYSFTPYYFEFWEGHESRLNKRKAYELKNNQWICSHLQP